MSRAHKKDGKVKYHCTICDEIIMDSVGKKNVQLSIQCDGLYTTWLHHHCAGLLKAAFEIVCKLMIPFTSLNAAWTNMNLKLVYSRK